MFFKSKEKKVAKAFQSEIEPWTAHENREGALNWLVGFEDASWDDVDTPT